MRTQVGQPAVLDVEHGPREALGDRPGKVVDDGGPFSARAAPTASGADRSMSAIS